MVMLGLQKLTIMNANQQDIGSEELAKENPKYAKKDVAMADDIIDLFQGLLLFKLGDTNNGFQEAVLVVLHKILSKRDIGISDYCSAFTQTTIDKEARNSRRSNGPRVNL